MTGSLTLSPLENKVTIAWKNDDQATVVEKVSFSAQLTTFSL